MWAFKIKWQADCKQNPLFFWYLWKGSRKRELCFSFSFRKVHCIRLHTIASWPSWHFSFNIPLLQHCNKTCIPIFPSCRQFPRHQASRLLLLPIHHSADTRRRHQRDICSPTSAILVGPWCKSPLLLSSELQGCQPFYDYGFSPLVHDLGKQLWFFSSTCGKLTCSQLLSHTATEWSTMFPERGLLSQSSLFKWAKWRKDVLQQNCTVPTQLQISTSQKLTHLRLQWSV